MENKSHEPAKKVSVSVARGTTQEIWMSVWEENCQGPNTGVTNEVELITIERWRFRSNKNATTLLTRTTEDWFRLARPPRAKIPLCLPYEGKLRLARRLREDSASPDPRGLAPPRPTHCSFITTCADKAGHSSQSQYRGPYPASLQESTIRIWQDGRFKPF